MKKKGFINLLPKKTDLLFHHELDMDGLIKMPYIKTNDRNLQAQGA